MPRHRVVVMSAALLVSALAACSSSSDSTKPSSDAGSPTASSDLTSTSSSTAFTSTISPLPGLRLTWPTPGWRTTDGAAQIVVDPPGLPGASLYVTKGLFPEGPEGGFLTTRKSAASVIAALHGLPALQTSRPVHEHIGEGLAVARIDMRLSRSAPASGFDYLAYRGSSVTPANFTIKQGMSVRVYVGVYRAPYGKELLDIAVEAPTGKVFTQWTALADRALESLRLPHGFVPGRTIYN